VSAAIQTRLAASAASDFATLWPAVEAEADARAHEAVQQLRERGQSEARALRAILERQRGLIERTLSERRQLGLFSGATPEEQKQWEADREHLETRLGKINDEIDREPRQIEALYQISLRRLSPVGLVYLWPATRM
jgi:hypothetical protein